jgi:predicted RNA-binding protein with PIN domain
LATSEAGAEVFVVDGATVTDGSGDQPLAPLVRQQLITIAADVIGRKPIAELPAGVRRFARFAPAKRMRMGAADIATALAVDDGFRHSVAEVVREASPDLVDQVSAGSPPATADPADVAVVAYLFRPDGWQQLLAQLSATLSQENDRSVAAGELQRMQSELRRLTDANAELIKARDAARTSAKATSAEHAKQVSELQHRVRTLQGELRAAQRTALQAEDAVADLTAAQQREDAGESAELRKARGRIASLVAELDAARRAVRNSRQHDDSRLWLLLEQISAGAAGLRRELDIKNPGVMPADSVPGHGEQLANRPSTLDAQLLERVLDGSHVHLIVDGYNLTKTGYPDMTLAEQRNRLVASLGPLAARTRIEVTIAFDGTAAPTGAAAAVPTPRGVRVLFSAPGELADDLIRTLLRVEPEGRTVVVASSDQAVAASARAARAWSTPAAVLLSRLERG